MLRFIGRTWLRVFGWKLESKTELPRRFVFIAAPHTTNWDFPFMMATAWALDIRIRWLGKHTLFEPPFGWFFRAMGGLPVDRRAPQGLVGQVVERFESATDLVLGIPPEGTRSKVDYWKSGFYHIAHGAKVPVGLGFLDFEKRTCGIGGFFMPTGDMRADMNIVRDFYHDVRGKFPDLECVPRLREEDAVVEAAQTAA
ncbi:Acyltransferase family protein [Minicystis rosea]|nr:Acyltransferase family protein [Minicystis rosea]